MQLTKPVIVMILLFSPGSSDVTSFLMTEARQHNTEIRLAVGKVADKVDQLATKVSFVCTRICSLNIFNRKDIHVVLSYLTLTDR